MKSIYPLIFSAFIFLSCLSAPEKNTDSLSATEFGEELAIQTPKDKTHYFVDAKTGLVVFQKDYPSDWEVVTKPVYNLDSDFPTFLHLIQNDKGLKAFNTSIQQYVSFQNQYYAQQMQSYGIDNIRAIVSPQQFIETEVKPMMERNGFTFLSERKIPEILALIEEQKRKFGMPNMDFNFYSTEWINKDNVKALVNFGQLVLTQDPNLMGGQPMQIWNYQLDYLMAPKADFETYLKIAINTEKTKVDNKNWEKYQMQVNNYRQQQRTIEHQQRMRNNQAQFEQHQQRMRDNSAAQDASHARFMDNLRGTSTGTSYASSSNHSNFIDMIREEQNVSMDGQTFKVEAGAENYWMNSDGKYIKSNNTFYDPNRDGLYNNQPWNLTTKQN